MSDHINSISRKISSVAAFQNESEYQYFQLFSNKTSVAISSVFSTSLWEEKIPFQAIDSCLDAPYIRNAAIALAALDKASLTTESHDVLGNGTASPEDHYRFALEHYQIALKGLRLWLTTGIRDEEIYKVLMAILMMIYFEACHGRSDAVLFHAESALKIIEQTLLRNPSRPIRYAPNAPPNIIDEQLVLLLCFISLQTGSKLPISNPELFEGDAKEQVRAHSRLGSSKDPRSGFENLRECSHYVSKVFD